VIRFGTGRQADFRAEKIEEYGIEGTAFDFLSPSGRTRLELPLIGGHNVMNAMAAVAAASVWGIGAEEAKRVFPTLKPADKRGEVVRFQEGFSVINDSYNSSPTALTVLIQLLAATPGYRRRIVVAGEMLELGGSSAELHRECGSAAASLRKIDWILGVQGHAADFLKGALAAGFPEDRTQFFENSVDASKFLEKFIAPGDLLLLKGSRGTKMEKVLEAIEAQHKRVASRMPAEVIEAGLRGHN
jgi:UDP-N-acetylmuramoyl-tripeptide--D-alanyl-D-alanine ligase